MKEPSKNAVRGIAGMLPLAILLGACGSDTRSADTDVAADPEATVAVASTGPEATAEAVWAHLESEAYRDNWAFWPGRGELYTGQEPHGMLLTTYVNSIAAEALADGLETMPAGAIIVKENFMPDSTYAAATVMYKVPGFDPDNNDWWWLKQLPDGTVEASGRGIGCISCHAGVRPHDFLWTKLLDAAEH